MRSIPSGPCCLHLQAASASNRLDCAPCRGLRLALLAQHRPSTKPRLTSALVISRFRNCSAAMATVALLAGSAARAGDFTSEQCGLISGVVSDVAKSLGTNKLSVDFRQSL